MAFHDQVAPADSAYALLARRHLEFSDLMTEAASSFGFPQLEQYLTIPFSAERRPVLHLLRTLHSVEKP